MYMYRLRQWAKPAGDRGCDDAGETETLALMDFLLKMMDFLLK